MKKAHVRENANARIRFTTLRGNREDLIAAENTRCRLHLAKATFEWLCRVQVSSKDDSTTDFNPAPRLQLWIYTLLSVHQYKPKSCKLCEEEHRYRMLLNKMLEITETRDELLTATVPPDSVGRADCDDMPSSQRPCVPLHCCATDWWRRGGKFTGSP